MIRYQGESIEFSVLLENKENVWQDYTKVVLYFYTNTSRIAKFIYQKGKADSASDGYIAITDFGNKYLRGTIPSDYTKTMNGQLLYDIVAYNGKTEKYHIKAKQTDIHIQYTPIKQEI